ncbi:MAG: DUF3567 domain-containing protein [Burkholderiaceae bacterium]|nr:DUF3567 domain-containing protein [Burkholderiaceae bacterium]MCS7101981.1 DUF3567 domain-containing protein [Burkholderiaceae bacterium]MCX7902457.1 DUF3567 domain-containing protein [Burkholderiaceae bacterium]MCX8006174.1 DUF3567 domain-containing protein [Burkholderiaceae bacterium]MDW8430551.1 DUF3567 domain-containing protein [Sutterellaceae bacterium]
MNMIYNSAHYCVLEFTGFGEQDKHPAGGYEIVDKTLRREIFLGGREAEQFRAQVAALIEKRPTPEEIDEFLGNYVGLMSQPVTLH